MTGAFLVATPQGVKNEKVIYITADERQNR